jgi:hypothetical protein
VAESKQSRIPMLRIKKGDSLKTIYEKAHWAFTAADLQKFTEIEDGILARQVVAELEALDREDAKNRKKKPRNGRSR